LDVVDDVGQSVIDDLIANLGESWNERANLIQIILDFLFSVVAKK